MIDVSWFISFSTSSRGFVLESICETLLQKISYGNTKDLTTLSSRVYTQGNFRTLLLHSVTQMKLSFSPLKILNRAKIEFWTLGRLKTKKMKINKNQIEKKRKGNIYPILSLKLWYQMICGNHYKGSKIRITLLIEYLKARTLDWGSNHSTSKIDHV